MYLYVCIRVCIYIYIYICIIYTHLYTNTHTQNYIYIYIYRDTYTHTLACMYVCMYVCMYACMYVCIVSISTHTCICIGIGICACICTLKVDVYACVCTYTHSPMTITAYSNGNYVLYISTLDVCCFMLGNAYTSCCTSCTAANHAVLPLNASCCMMLHANVCGIASYMHCSARACAVQATLSLHEIVSLASTLEAQTVWHLRLEASNEEIPCQP